MIEDPLEVIQAAILENRAYEPTVSSIIAKTLLPGDVFVDVGGNIGNHSLIAAGTGAEVIAFEPVPRLANRIEASINLNRFVSKVTTVRTAVGAERSTAVLHIAKRTDDGSHSLLKGVEAKEIRELTVPIESLDRLLQMAALVPSMIKVDVEGYEARVLDGAKAILSSKHPPVWLIETADRLADQIGESAASVARRLEDVGYSLWKIPDYGPVERVYGTITPELMNYCAVHEGSAIRSRVERALADLSTSST